MSTIVLVSGSVRRDSLNAAAIAEVGRIMARLDPSVRLACLNLRELPHYDADVDAADESAAVRAARELAASADVLVISTPSYNGAMPGVLKNALDWLSRPWGNCPLTGKPVMVMSVSPGPRGGVNAQPGLRAVLEDCGAAVIKYPSVAIGNAEALAAARFTAPDVAGELEGLAETALTYLRHEPAWSAA